MKQSVVVLGASPKEERYSNKAVKMLQEYGHTIFPISPRKCEIYGLETISSMAEIKTSVDTVTVYVGPAQSTDLAAGIIALRPKRVIFNPGTESELLEKQIAVAGIEVIHACTLVLLRTNQFDI